MAAEAKRYAAFCLLAVSFLVVFFFKTPERTPFSGRAGRAPDAAERPTALSATSTARHGAAGAPARVVFPGFPIDINTAGRAELMTLPGVGEKTADRILEWRRRKGRFGSIEELMEVRGIGPGKYERLRGLITAGKEAKGPGTAK